MFIGLLCWKDWSEGWNMDPETLLFLYERINEISSFYINAKIGCQGIATLIYCMLVVWNAWWNWTLRFELQP